MNNLKKLSNSIVIQSVNENVIPQIPIQNSMQSSLLFSSEFTEGKIKQHKKRANYTINKHTIDRFKVVVDKDMRKMSNVVENLIR